MVECFVFLRPLGLRLGSLAAFGVLLASNVLFAQAAPPAAKQSQEDKEIAAMRKDIRKQRKDYISSALPLTPQEAQAFWPVYEEYANEIAKLGDRRLVSLKQLAELQVKMSPGQAAKWMAEMTQQDKAMVELRQKYLPAFQKVLPEKKALQFFGVDRRTQMMIDLDLPLKH